MKAKQNRQPKLAASWPMTGDQFILAMEPSLKDRPGDRAERFKDWQVDNWRTIQPESQWDRDKLQLDKLRREGRSQSAYTLEARLSRISVKVIAAGGVPSGQSRARNAAPPDADVVRLAAVPAKP